MKNIVISPRLLLAAASLVVAGSAQAEPPKNDGLWRGAGGAALAINSGNTDNSALNINVDVAATTAADKTSLGGAYNYGKSKVDGKTTTTADKWNVYGQYDYNLSARTFVFGKVAFEGDKLSDLNLRSTVAGGLGYKVIDTKELSFNLFGGAAYSTDKYDLAKTIGGKTDTKFSRSSVFIGEESSHVLSATTTFKQRLELYPGLSGDKAMIAKFSAGLAVAMSSTLSLALNVTDSYNSKPPANAKKNDIGFFAGVNVKLGAN